MFLNLGEIWDYVNFLLRKEKEGRTLTPKQYNDLLKVVSLEVFQSLWTEYEENQGSTDSMVRFAIETALTMSGTLSTDFPTDYYHITGLRDGDINIDIVTQLEWDSILNDPVLKPTASSPRAKLRTISSVKQIEINPAPSTAANLTHLRRPVTPFFDYCIDDSTDEIIYMEVGWLITAGNALEDGSSNVIAAAVTHPDSPALPYTSVSVEFDYEDEDTNKAKTLILEKVSLSNKQTDKHAYASQKEMQLKAE